MTQTSCHLHAGMTMSLVTATVSVTCSSTCSQRSKANSGSFWKVPGTGCWDLCSWFRLPYWQMLNCNKLVKLSYTAVAFFPPPDTIKSWWNICMTIYFVNVTKSRGLIPKLQIFSKIKFKIECKFMSSTFNLHFAMFKYKWSFFVFTLRFIYFFFTG